MLFSLRYRQILICTPVLILLGCAGATPRTEDPNVPKSALQIEAEEYCSRKRGDDVLPPKRFSTDGCSMWPDSDWRHCCVAHDIAYWCGGSYQDRVQADKKLEQCLAESGHPGTGAVMRLGTRIGGGTLWPAPWRWGYGWPWPESGKVDKNEVSSSVDGEDSTEVDRQ